MEKRVAVGIPVAYKRKVTPVPEPLPTERTVLDPERALAGMDLPSLSLCPREEGASQRQEPAKPVSWS